MKNEENKKEENKEEGYVEPKARVMPPKEKKIYEPNRDAWEKLSERERRWMKSKKADAEDRVFTMREIVVYINPCEDENDERKNKLIDALEKILDSGFRTISWNYGIGEVINPQHYDISLLEPSKKNTDEAHTVDLVVGDIKKDEKKKVLERMLYGYLHAKRKCMPEPDFTKYSFVIILGEINPERNMDEMAEFFRKIVEELKDHYDLAVKVNGKSVWFDKSDEFWESKEYLFFKHLETRYKLIMAKVGKVDEVEVNIPSKESENLDAFEVKSDTLDTEKIKDNLFELTEKQGYYRNIKRRILYPTKKYVNHIINNYFNCREVKPEIYHRSKKANPVELEK